MSYFINMHRLLLWLLLSFVLVSCSNSKRVSKKKTTLEAITISAKDNPNDIFRATTTKAWDIDNTTLEMSFNMIEKTANGKVWLTLHPYFYSTDSIILDAKSMVIDSVALVNNGTMQSLQYRYNDSVLRIKFSKSYNSTDVIGLYIKYTAMPYRDTSGGSAAINDDKGLYFINTDNAIPTKPVQIWTQGETEANSHWVPTIDKPNQRTKTHFKLTVPDSFTTLSNGRLEQRIFLGNYMHTDIWVMDKPIQVYAMMFAIGKFSVVKDRDALGKPVEYYVEPEFAPYAKEMFKNTPEMIEYFSKVTGVQYPWNKYSQVVVRDYVSGAMENTSASLFGEFMNKTHREMLDDDGENTVSHELFHQWFGDYVTAESWTNLTLNESFATFGEQLWRKYKYGKAQGDRLAMGDLWNYVYGSSRWNGDPALVRYYYRDKEDMFDGTSYQKGASILRYLHALIGEEAFSQAMKLYLTKNALSSAEAAQWRMAVEEVTGMDWNWFFNQWYNTGGHPVLDMKYTYDDVAQKMTVTLNQTQTASAYRLPVNVRVIYDKAEMQNVTLVSKKETLTYPYRNGIKPVVVVDDEHIIVGEEKYNLEPWQWLRVFKNSSDNIINKELALGNCSKTMQDSAAKQVFALALKDDNEDVRYTALEDLKDLKDKQVPKQYLSDIIRIAERDDNNKNRAGAFYVLNAIEEKSAKGLALVTIHDSSYRVAAAALTLLNTLDADTGYKVARKIAETDPRGSLVYVIWGIVAKKGNNNDFGLYENKVSGLYGSKKSQMVSSLATYLKNVKDTKVFNKGVALMFSLTRGEPIKSYRLALGVSLVDVGAYYRDKKNNVNTYTEKNEAEARLAVVKTNIENLIKQENDEKNKAKLKTHLDKL
jgi:aminopeptidase N